MKIKVLGTRGEIKESARLHARKSGVLIDDIIMLDCGEPEFIKHNPKYLLLTHLHPDHAFFMRYHEQININIPIFAPETYDRGEIIVIKNKIILDNYNITPIPTIHSIKVKSNAYLIEHNNKKFLYTGDMIWIEKQYRHLLTSVDLVITEASFHKKGGLIRRDAKTNLIFGHTGIPDLVAFFKKYSKTILFVHFGSWFYHDIRKARLWLKNLAKQNQMILIVGYDGLEISI